MSFIAVVRTRSIVAIAVSAGIFCVGGCPRTEPKPGGTFSEIVVFGDSLSDIGNDYLETLGLAPHAPYSDGRFSNGRLWIQHVADHFNLELRPSRDGGLNFAFGAAETGTGRSSFDGLPLIENMRDQLASYHRTPDESVLFVIWGGANDLFFDLNRGGDVDPEQMATNIAIIIIELYAHGGRHFVVPNLPEFGDLPHYFGTDNEDSATAQSNAFNAALNDWLDRLEGLPGLTLFRPDVATFFNETIANPPPPITNTTEASWTGNFFGTDGTLVSDPDTHVFWDDVHPTRVSHELLGQYVIDLIEVTLNGEQ